jgi:chromosome segregation ATPase
MHHSFDTHSAVKRFILSGLKEKQAEAIVQTIYESRDYDLSNLATKADLIGTEKKLDDRITGVEQRLDAKITGVEQRLDAKITAVEQKLDSKITAVEQKLDSKFTELSIDIANVRIEVAQVRGEIEKSKNETLKWFIGIAITLVGTMTGIMTLLFRYFLQ